MDVAGRGVHIPHAQVGVQDLALWLPIIDQPCQHPPGRQSSGVRKLLDASPLRWQTGCGFLLLFLFHM